MDDDNDRLEAMKAAEAELKDAERCCKANPCEYNQGRVRKAKEDLRLLRAAGS